MSNTLTMELDIAGEVDDLSTMLIECTRDYDSITYRIVDGVGPAGWPVVRFVGAHVDMYAFLIEYCGGDHAQAYELLMA